MEKLADYNLELSLLQLKYEHLAERCRNLLKPWPIPDTTEGEKQCRKDSKVAKEDSEVVKEDSKVVKEDSEVVKKDSVVEVTEVSEWDQLQSLLSKAQKVYARGPKERPSLTLASITCESELSDCNLGIAKQAETGSGTSSRTGLKPKSGSHSRTKSSQSESKSKSVTHYKSKTSVGSHGSGSGLRKKTKHPKVLDALGVGIHSQVEVKHTSLKADSVSGPHPPGSHLGSRGNASKCESSLSREPKAGQVFSLQQNGTRLSMPSKYYRLQKSIHRCIEELEGQPPNTTKAAATHFLRRLQPKDSDSNHIKLQLAVERTRLLKTRLELVTPELSMAERSSWQDLLLVRTKLDSIKQSYQSLLDTYNHTSSSPAAGPSQEPAGPEIGITTTSQLTSRCEAIKLEIITPSSSSSLIFSSLDEWSDASRTEQLRRHRQWEIEFLAAVEEKILPLVSRCMSSPSAGAEWTSKAVAMIRTLHLVSQIPSKPIYLDAEQIIE